MSHEKTGTAISRVHSILGRDRPLSDEDFEQMLGDLEEAYKAHERITAKLGLSASASPTEVADAVDIMLKRLQELEQKLVNGDIGDKQHLFIAPESIDSIVLAILQATRKT